MKNLNVVLDVSSVIWDEDDYMNNKYKYYDLVDGITYFFEKLENENPRVLLSGNLRNQLLANFPYGKPPYNGSDFETQTLKFLSKVETCEYPSLPISDIISIPDLIKGYYTIEVKEEIYLLISKMHSDSESENVYFTFNYLWDNEEKLRTQLEKKSKEYQTIVVDRKVNANNDLTELDDFISKLKPVFEHNPKHNIKDSRNKIAWERSDDKLGFVSQLSCYNGYDNEKPQDILNKRYPQKIDSRYIGYDYDNFVYVVFRNHGTNKYHGYDEYNENNIEKIPLKVKDHFNSKNG